MANMNLNNKWVLLLDEFPETYNLDTRIFTAPTDGHYLFKGEDIFIKKGEQLPKEKNPNYLTIDRIV